ncbi:zinc-ribbon domain-containing protein [Methanobrevibacter sp. V74]|uniref:zinc-ribbon domain-containing protein n=1 Tax=Methanobrevibacter sp. V74 TaxID=3064279 RepID=UPI0027335604|nr:zinc-ribbon domain-containing protein [Methanobrevibacter sp. V74]
MPLSQSKLNVDKNEIKRGEKILKDIMGGKLVKNRKFARKLALNGFTVKNINKTWNKINEQIKTELKNGELNLDDIEKRIDEIILEISGNSHIITTEEEYVELYEKKANGKTRRINKNVRSQQDRIKQEILSKRKISIQLPYQSNGVNSTIIGGAVFGTAGLGLGAFDEGNIKWKRTELILMDNGLNVKSNGAVALYEDIKSVVLGKRGFIHTIMTIITHDKNNLIFKVASEDSTVLKEIIEDNLTSNICSSNDDILFKYAELYEKGLLTKEEFDLKKQELFNKDSKSVEEETPRFCGNCGEVLNMDDKFCTNCGANLDHH